MTVCPAAPRDAMPAADQAGLELLGQAGMVAVRAADLRSPAGAGLGTHGRTALTAAGAGPIRTGEVTVFLKPVVVAKAVVRRDGRAQPPGTPPTTPAWAWPSSGVDELTGTPGLIDQIARSAPLEGKVNGKARRAMTPALTIRLTLLTTSTGDASYAETLDALLGDLAGVPWQRPFDVPTPTVVSTWREAVGPRPLQQLRDKLLAAVSAEHQERDWRAVAAGDLDACSIDGSLVRPTPFPRDRQPVEPGRRPGATAGPPTTAITVRAPTHELASAAPQTRSCSATWHWHIPHLRHLPQHLHQASDQNNENPHSALPLPHSLHAGCRSHPGFR
jgi:hypothetical protein